MDIKVFWLEPTDTMRVQLRRYHSGRYVEGQLVAEDKCPVSGYHDARVLIGDVPYATDADLRRPPDDDPRWPTHCQCGYAFTSEDARQVFTGRLHSGAPDGQLYSLHDAPVGAMWDAAWMREGYSGECWTGPDGLTLSVKTPGGDWMVDSQCSNCTRDQYGPKEIEGRLYDRVWLGRTHWCWVRHGDPRTGHVHVDKNGETCSAGAGSIIAGGWHGFLHNNYLTNA